MNLYLIAEIGINHNGSLDITKSLLMLLLPAIGNSIAQKITHNF